MKAKLFITGITFLSLCFVTCQQTSKSSSESTDSTKTEEASNVIDEKTTENKEFTEELSTKDEKPKGIKYRSDGFRPGVTSEYLQIDTDNNKNVIKAIWYWSTVDEKPVKLTIHNQQFSSGEISGYTADLGFPNSAEVIRLGMIEDKANLTWEDEQFQEFVYEDGQ